MGKRMYGIQVTGYGKRRKYAVRRIVQNGTYPVGYCKVWKTEEEARADAAALGVEISVVGDLWELVAAYDDAFRREWEAAVFDTRVTV